MLADNLDTKTASTAGDHLAKLMYERATHLFFTNVHILALDFSDFIDMLNADGARDFRSGFASSCGDIRSALQQKRCRWGWCESEHTYLVF